jgi:hypothetical protein
MLPSLQAFFWMDLLEIGLCSDKKGSDEVVQKSGQSAGLGVTRMFLDLQSIFISRIFYLTNSILNEMSLQISIFGRLPVMMISV